MKHMQMLMLNSKTIKIMFATAGIETIDGWYVLLYTTIRYLQAREIICC